MVIERKGQLRFAIKASKPAHHENADGAIVAGSSFAGLWAGSANGLESSLNIKTGIPSGISRVKNGNRKFSWENASTDFDPVFAVFPEFFPESVFFRKYDIRSVKMVFGVGRYGNFPFLLSSLQR